MNNPPDDQQPSLDDLIERFDRFPQQSGSMSKYVFKERLIALIESARLEKQERTYSVPLGAPEAMMTAYNNKADGYNEAIDAQMQAILNKLKGTV